MDTRSVRRSSEDPPSNRDRLAIMKLEFRMPQDTWFYGFTTRHPDLVVEVLNSIPVPGDNSLGEVEIGGPPVDWTSEIRKSPDVLEVQVLAMLLEVGRYRVRYHQPAVI